MGGVKKSLTTSTKKGPRKKGHDEEELPEVDDDELITGEVRSRGEVVRDLLVRIEKATEPRRMKKAAARECLKEVVEEIEMRIEALDEEIEQEEGEGQ